ncbi:MAG: S8 family serine peptidase, partial [Gammaproteobacteria bacterium]|nr:S8 family serine peptidase [Gammaproteobacteria bacterium]
FVGDNVGDLLTDDPSSQDGNPDIPMGIWNPEIDIFTFTGDPSVGDGVDNDGDGLPDLGVFHGTAVAALAAAMTDNLSVELPGEYEGMAGVCPDCRIMPVRMVNAEGGGFGSDAAAAIYYATNMGADVLNLSWGFDLDALDVAGEAEVAVITDAINYAVSQGVIIVASAGNSGGEAVRFPASMESTLAVGSCNWLDQRSFFSSYAPAGEIPDNGLDDDANGRIDDVVDIVAPGEYIWSAYVYSVFEAQYSYIFGDFETVPGLDAYENVSQGTSFAAPLVSGYIGLLLSQHPGASFAQLRQVLRSNAVDILDPEAVGSNLPGYDQYSGFGRLRMVIPANLPGVDSDGDGLSDEAELALGTNPNDLDSDDDGLVDGPGGLVPIADYPGGIDSNTDGFVDGEQDFGTDPILSNIGDVAPRGNLDNLVNVADLVVLMQLVTETIQPTPLELKLGDINNSGQINAGDLLLMQQSVFDGVAP